MKQRLPVKAEHRCYYQILDDYLEIRALRDLGFSFAAEKYDPNYLKMLSSLHIEVKKIEADELARKMGGGKER